MLREKQMMSTAFSRITLIAIEMNTLVIHFIGLTAFNIYYANTHYRLLRFLYL